MGHETINYVTILRHTCVCLRLTNTLICHIRSMDAFFKRICTCGTLGPQEKSFGLI